MRVRAVPLLATVSAFSQSISPLIFTLACSLATILASAQTVPLTATVTRITYTISADGGITLSQEERGTFSRNTDGDGATHVQVMKNGQFATGTSQINRRKEGKSFIIDDERQQYSVTLRAGNLAVATEGKSPSTPAVTRTIGGIKCVAVPLRDGKTGQTIGKAWISLEYGITVRSEANVLNSQTGQPDGLVVEELSDIQVGVAPDPSDSTFLPGTRK